MKWPIALFSLPAFGFAVLVGMSAAPAMGGEEHGGKEVKVTIDQVPAKVEDAILKEMGKDGCGYDVVLDPNGKVLARVKETGEDGKDEAAGGSRRKVKIEKVAIDKATAEVKAAVLSGAAKTDYRLGTVCLRTRSSLAGGRLAVTGFTMRTAHRSFLTLHLPRGR